MNWKEIYTKIFLKQLDKSVKNVFDILVKIYDQGYNRVNMVVGSDRVNEFEALIGRYNAKKGRHGFYNFNKITVISAGERDPDAEGVEGMSASKMRAAATDGDFKTFSMGLPSGFRDAQSLFNDVRKGMGMSAIKDFREHVQLEPVSQVREAYVQGELYNEGDVVVVKESDEIGQVIMLGSNYVLVEMAEGKRMRKWLDDVEKIEEASTAQDKDISDRKGTQPARYHSGLEKSTKAKRDAQFKKQSKMDSRDPAAYKPAPGDATAKTKPSKYTKSFKQMFGEDVNAVKDTRDKIKAEIESDKEKHDRMLDRARITAARAKNKATDPTAHRKEIGAYARTEDTSYTDVISEEAGKSIADKAKKSGISASTLRKVYNRGVAAWRTGHRPGTTPEQWGHARVNAFIVKKKKGNLNHDKDLA